MPLYEFECNSCGHRFEELHRSEVPYTKCTQCGKVAKKLVSVVNHSFGWRLTDRSLYGGKGDPKDEYEKDI